MAERTSLWYAAVGGGGLLLAGCGLWWLQHWRAQASATKALRVAPQGVLDLIGNTPLMRINSLSDATGCEIWAKVESMNPGGSSKDRIALQILRDAEASGALVRGQPGVLVEGTSGSTGISLAMLARACGYSCHIVMPDDVAAEKSLMLRQLGATVQLVKPASITHPDNYVAVAQRVAEALNKRVHAHAHVHVQGSGSGGGLASPAAASAAAAVHSALDHTAIVLLPGPSTLPACTAAAQADNSVLHVTGDVTGDDVSGPRAHSSALAVEAALHALPPAHVAPHSAAALASSSADVLITSTSSSSSGSDSSGAATTAAAACAPRRAVFCNQFETDSNFRAHYATTGPEIWAQTGGKIDAFVMGAGTGGTIAGVGMYLKKQAPRCRVYLVDPPGSALYNKVAHGVAFAPQQRERTLKRHRYDTIIEGVGLDRVTANFAAGLAALDGAFQCTDAEAVEMSRYLLRHDGIFCGSSSAMNCVGAVKAARALGLGSGRVIVTLLCDHGSRHTSRFWNAEYLARLGLTPTATGRSLSFVADSPVPASAPATAP